MQIRKESMKIFVFEDDHYIPGKSKKQKQKTLELLNEINKIL